MKKEFIRPVPNPVLECVIPVQEDSLRSVLLHEDRMNVDSDISLLLNENRLTNQGIIDELRNRFSQRLGSASPYEGMSDEEMFACTPSRSLQSVSERKAWTEYVCNRYEREIQRKKAELESTTEKVEETKSE